MRKNNNAGAGNKKNKSESNHQESTVSLRSIIESRPDLLLDPICVQGILSDIYPSERWKTNVMMIAYKSIDIIDELRNIANTDISLRKLSWIGKLQKDYRIEEEACKWAADEWSSVMNERISEQIVKAIEEKNVQKQSRRCYEEKKAFLTQIEAFLDKNEADNAQKLLDETDYTRYGIEPDIIEQIEIRILQIHCKEKISRALETDDIENAETAFQRLKENCHDIEVIRNYELLIDDLSRKLFQRTKIIQKIETCIRDNNPEEAETIIKESDLISLGIRNELLQQYNKQIEDLYISLAKQKLDRYLASDDLKAAEEYLSRMENKYSVFVHIQEYKEKIKNAKIVQMEKIIRKTTEEDRRRQGTQILERELSKGYQKAIAAVAEALSVDSGNEQAIKWLKDNPPKHTMKNCSVNKTGGNEYTVAWTDYDSSVSYMVRRNKGIHPEQLDDGELVGTTSDKLIKDTIPEDEPGALWYYTVFAIRNLDGAYYYEKCMQPAVWLSEPFDVRGEITEKNGKRGIVIRWGAPPGNCNGIVMTRLEKKGILIQKKAIVDCSERYQGEQAQHQFIDWTVEKGCNYQYILSYEWLIDGTIRNSSSIETESIHI